MQAKAFPQGKCQFGVVRGDASLTFNPTEKGAKVRSSLPPETRSGADEHGAFGFTQRISFITNVNKKIPEKEKCRLLLLMILWRELLADSFTNGHRGREPEEVSPGRREVLFQERQKA